MVSCIFITGNTKKYSCYQKTVFIKYFKNKKYIDRNDDILLWRNNIESYSYQIEFNLYDEC